MRVLVVHNRYRTALPSGENTVVDSEIEMLRDASVEVFTYIRESDEIENFGPVKRAGLAVRPIWSFEDSRELRSKIRAVRPDVVHLHNVYPLISPAAIRVANSEHVPVVQTVHNYRFVCANGLHFRDGQVCVECCQTSLPWPAVKYGCYRDSRTQSAVIAASLMLHRRTWDMVDLFLPVSDFVAERLLQHGVPAERLKVCPFVGNRIAVRQPLGTGFAYVGRLEEAKGITLLMEAWAMSGLDGAHELRIAGSGALETRVSDFATKMKTVTYLGKLNEDGVCRLLDSSAVCVVPSVVWETAGLVARQALEMGRLVVCSQSGNLKTLADHPDAICVPELNPEYLANALTKAAERTSRRGSETNVHPNARESSAIQSRNRPSLEEHLKAVGRVR